jgi:hypothetical protein
MTEELISKVLKATGESGSIELKSSFDPNSKGEWFEILKDFIAIVNSGGGAIAIGLDDQGKPTGENVQAIAKYDPAKITDKIEAVTGIEFDDFEIHNVTKNGISVIIIIIGGSQVPIPFKRNGQYSVENKKYPEVAFRAGTVYFRHGAKSAPGTYSDFSKAINRRLEQIRQEWLSGVQKVVNAPEGSLVQVVRPEFRLSDSPEATPIRWVNDPSAPGYRFIDPNSSHPYRLIDALVEVLKGIGYEKDLNWYDIYAVRKSHKIEDRPDMFFGPKYGRPQYSRSFVN